VCFTIKDLARVLDFTPRTFNKYLDTWGWHGPKYQSRNAVMLQASKGLSWKAVNVYSYPEAVVIIEGYKNGLVTNPKGFGKRTSPNYAKKINRQLSQIRDEIEVTYD
jgi:hypothetical protein